MIGERPGRPGTDGDIGGSESTRERTGVLRIRAWTEADGQLRARVLALVDDTGVVVELVDDRVVLGARGVRDAVDRWLATFEPGAVTDR